MPITQLELNTVTRALAVARKLLDEVKPVLDSLNVLYNAGGGVGLKSTISQGGLDGVTSFSGLTKTQLDDGLFALTSTVKGGLDAAYTSLAELAARA